MAESNALVIGNFSGEGWTTLDVKKLKYRWTIQNFLFYGNEEGEVIESPKFPKDSSGGQWWIRLRVKYAPFTNSDMISIFLCKDGFSSAPKAKFSFAFVKRNGECTSPRILNSIESQTWGFPTFCKRSNLLEHKENLLPNDTLTILCNIDVYGSPTKITTGSVNFDNIATTGTELSQDFKKLLTNQEYSDITIIIGDKKFLAHKLILSARSPVFKAMFQHDMLESKKNEVNITDVQPEAFEKMLQFIYSDEAPTDLEGVCADLLTAAEKYGLDKLKTWCEKFLCESITVENTAEMLIFADRYNAKQLLGYVTCFFHRHKMEIMDTPGFKSMMGSMSHPNVVISLLRGVNPM